MCLQGTGKELNNFQGKSVQEGRVLGKYLPLLDRNIFEDTQHSARCPELLQMFQAGKAPEENTPQCMHIQLDRRPQHHCQTPSSELEL